MPSRRLSRRRGKGKRVGGIQSRHRREKSWGGMDGRQDIKCPTEAPDWNAYFVVKCAGKGNLPDGEHTDLKIDSMQTYEEGKYAKTFTTQARVDLLNKFKAAAVNDCQRLSAGWFHYAAILHQCIALHNTESKPILFVFDGDKFQFNSPFTKIIARLSNAVGEISTCICKQREEWNTVSVKGQDTKGSQICKTWKDGGDIDIDFVELVDVPEKERTLEVAQLCWFYGIVPNLTVSPMKDDEYKSKTFNADADCILDKYKRRIYGQKDPEDCFAISTALQELTDLQENKTDWQTALSMKYLQIFTKNTVHHL